jgi:hypothetical protein
VIECRNLITDTRIPYLEDNTRKAYQLLILHSDDRAARAQEFISDPGRSAPDLYHYI